MPVKTTLFDESVCEGEPKFGKTGGGRWPSGGLRCKSPGVSRGVKALSGETWVQTGWKWLEAPQRLQLVPHWGTGFRRATPRKISVGRSFEGAKAPHLPHRACLGESGFGSVGSITLRQEDLKLDL